LQSHKPIAGQPSNGNEPKMKLWPIRDVLRSAINPAPYNPRKISEYARRELKKSLQDFGLAEALVWNERTGHLVGGHQRIDLLDEDRNYPDAGDYTLSVSVVNLTPRRERALNVRLNNPQNAGTFDSRLLSEMLTGEDSPTLQEIGMTGADLDVVMKSATSTPADEVQPGTVFQSEVVDIINRLRKDGPDMPPEYFREANRRQREARKHGAEAAEDDAEYFIVTLGSRAERLETMQRLGLDPEAPYITMESLIAAIERRNAGR